MIVVAGDFNANSSSQSYVHMTQTAGFSDGRSKAEVRKTQLMGSARVWGKTQNWNKGALPIDHIFYKGTTAVAEEWQILTDTYDMHANISTDINKIGINYDLSDHQGVFTRFREVVG
jgi:endonuclease/exonuclease/phosphatase family metal-dependent hydrolase